MSTSAKRNFYTSDGGVLWSRFPILLFGSLAVGLAGGWCLDFLQNHNLRMVVLVPCLMALVVGVVARFFFWFSHCRNQWLAVSIGIATGLILYLGTFYFQLVSVLPPGAKGRIDLLPQYIHLRMMTDVIQDSDNPNQNAQPNPVENYLLAILELVASAGIVAGAVWLQTQRFYSSLLGRWMNRETFHLALGSGPACIAAIEQNRLAEFLQTAQPTNQALNSCQVHIDYVAGGEISTLDYPLYITIEESLGKKGLFSGRELKKSNVHGLQLYPEEVLILFSRYPKLKKLLENQIEELRDFTPATVIAESTDTGPVAVVEPIEEEFRQRVRTRWYPWIVNLIDFIPVILIIGGILIAIAGVSMLEKQFSVLGIILTSIGASIVFATGLQAVIFPCLLSDIWVDRRLRHEIRKRPNPIADPDDFSLQSFCLNPRENFMKVKLVTGADQLLMSLNHKTDEIQLEGDSDRYWIPTSAILDCSTVCFFSPVDTHQRTQLWHVRLLVRFDSGTKELLLSRNQRNLKQQGNKGRLLAAEAVCREIQALCGTQSES